MVFSVAPRRTPAPATLSFAPVSSTLAIALALCWPAAHARAQAQDLAQDPFLPSVVVTGARFASDPSLAPIGATVITAADIRRAGAGDVNQAIRKIGGVLGRQSLDASPDFSLDLRGFGANSSQNMVVVLDGVRLSENELANPVLSTIPIDTVERIDIIRGGASVLYGDGATGGVIRIATRRADKAGRRGSASAELGSFGQRELRVSNTATWDGFAFDAAIGHQRSDNYRANSGFRQTAFSGGFQSVWEDGRIGLRIDSARQDARLPGSLTLAQFEADPRQSATPDDFGSLDQDRYTAFVEQRIGGVDFAAELSRRDKTVKASYFFGGFAAPVAYRGRQTQFSPRLRQLRQGNGMLNELVAGIDLIAWKRMTGSGFSQADAGQDSKALYLRDEVKWDGPRNARLAIGARRELFDKRSDDPAPFTTATYRARQAHNAWEVQGSVDPLPRLTLHAKAGQSYRVANADENAYTPRSNVTLAGQVSRDLEFGAAIEAASVQLSARVFRHALRNEIFYDPTAGLYGANTNLDPTRRQGFELDASARLAAGWRLAGHFQRVAASFTGGPNAGREMVLVPKNVLSARLSWAPGSGHSADIGAQWVSSQRYGSDFTNSCAARIPAYATVDARYARKLGPWELALSSLNLTGKRYYSNAFGCESGIYPSDGRQLKLSARYDF